MNAIIASGTWIPYPTPVLSIYWSLVLLVICSLFSTALHPFSFCNPHPLLWAIITSYWYSSQCFPLFQLVVNIAATGTFLKIQIWAHCSPAYNLFVISCSSRIRINELSLPIRFWMVWPWSLLWAHGCHTFPSLSVLQPQWIFLLTSYLRVLACMCVCAHVCAYIYIHIYILLPLLGRLPFIPSSSWRRGPCLREASSDLYILSLSSSL